MDPHADASAAAVLAALETARGLLREASVDAVALRSRIDALADATDWRARATAAYRAGVAALADEVATLVRRIELSDADLAHEQAALRVRALARG